MRTLNTAFDAGSNAGGGRRDAAKDRAIAWTIEIELRCCVIRISIPRGARGDFSSSAGRVRDTGTEL